MKASAHPSSLKVALVALMFLSYTDTYVFAKPRGGQVASGTASFTQDGNLTVITASNRSIINYQSFDIAKGETVRFVQPNASASVLNRVLSPNPTNIFGSLQANGIVVIANPYGVFFQNGSVINVGGLIAGAGKVSNADFTAGKIHFTDLSGDVRNDGVIAADNRIALMGANVVNTGSMTAARGVAMMVSGPDVYVGEKNGNIFVQANGKAVRAAGAASGGKTGSTGSVTNSGTVSAPRVTLGAGDMYSTAIVNSGLLQGRAVAVNAGKNGSATVGGKIDATNRAVAGTGGRIDVTGGTVALRGATLDASGLAGGGSVRIGGDLHGTGTLAHAQTTTVDAGSMIKADATGTAGDGGTVVLWSDAKTLFSGTISAQPGTTGGTGGQVEVSSHDALGFHGLVNAGATGSLLLDPSNIEVTAGGGPVAANTNPVTTTATTPSVIPVGGTILDNTTTVSQASLEATTGAITLTASNDIKIDAGLTNGGLTLKSTVPAVFQAGANTVANTPSVGSFVIPTNEFITNPGGITIKASGVSLGGTQGINAGNTYAIQTGALNTNSTTGNGGNVLLQITSATAVNTNNPAPVRTGAINTSTTFATGNGGAITINGSAANNAPNGVTTGDLTTNGETNGGAVTLKSSGANVAVATPGALAISTGNITTEGSTSGNVLLQITSPTAVSLTNPAPVSTGDILTDGAPSGSITINGSAANNAPNGITTGNLSTATYAGNAGAITLTTSGANGAGTNALSIGGVLGSSNDPAGAASTVRLTLAATNVVAAGNAAAPFSTGYFALTGEFGGPGGTVFIGGEGATLPTSITVASASNNGQYAINARSFHPEDGTSPGGTITLRSSGAITVYGLLRTDSSTANSGNITLGSTGGSVTVTNAVTTDAVTNAGAVTINAAGAISIGESNPGGQPAITTTSQTGAGGAVSLGVAANGAVPTSIVLGSTANAAADSVVNTSATGNTGAGGAVTLNAAGPITIRGGMDASSAGQYGGPVSLTANGGGVTVAGSITDTSAAAVPPPYGGAVSINATGAVSVGASNAAGVNAIDTSSATGPGGAITITGVTANGATTYPTSIIVGAAGTAVDSAVLNSAGAANSGGSITLNANGPITVNGAVNASLAGGIGGNVSITGTGTVAVGNAINVGNIFTASTGDNGGTVTVNGPGTLTVGSVDSSSTSSAGGAITLGQAAAPRPTSITTGALTSSGPGAGGAVTLSTSGAIQVNGAVDASSSGAVAGALNLTGAGVGVTGNLTDTSAVATTGTGGTGSLKVTGGGVVSLGSVDVSSAAGPGGTVAIGTTGTAPTGITVGQAANTATTSAINTAATGTGNGNTGVGGAITLNSAGAITVNGVTNAASAGAAGGQINLTSQAGGVTLTGSVTDTSAVATTAAGGTGAVTIRAGSAGNPAVVNVGTSNAAGVNAIDTSAAAGPGGAITITGATVSGVATYPTAINIGVTGTNPASSLLTSKATGTANGSTGAGGAIAITAIGPVSLYGAVDASSAGAAGGNISFKGTSGGSLSAGNFSSAGATGGGTIQIGASGILSLGTLSSAATSGAGGAITLGNPVMGVSVPSSVLTGTLTSTGTTTGGNIFTQSNGNINVGAVNTSAATGGSFTALTAVNNSTATDTFAAINTQGTTGAAGAVSIGTSGPNNNGFAPASIALNGNITANNTTSNSGGAVTIASRGGISGGASIDTSTSTNNGAGGNVSVTGNGAVTLGAVNASGYTAGGTVGVAAGTGLLTVGNVSTYGGDSAGASLTLSGTGVDTGALSSYGGAGSGGNILVTSKGEIKVAGAISTAALGAGGNGGNVSLLTDTTPGAVSVQGITTSSATNGNAGNITVGPNGGTTTQPTSLTLGGDLVAIGGSSAGNGGTISLTTSGNLSGTQAISTYSSQGTGGAITTNSAGVTLGALQSFGANGGGNVSLTSNGGINLSFISAASTGASGTLPGGNVSLLTGANAGSVSVGLIGTDSANSGNAGSITIGGTTPANLPTSITLKGSLTADAVAASGGASGGAVSLATSGPVNGYQTINTHSVSGSGGTITATGSGTGIQLGDLFSYGSGTGNGGNVTVVTTGTGSIRTGATNAYAANGGQGGTVTMISAGALNNASVINTGTTGNGAGGAVTLEANGNLTVGDAINTSSSGGGAGGNVSLLTETTTGTISTNGINTSSGSGAGGNLFVGNDPNTTGSLLPTSITVGGAINTAGTPPGTITLLTSGALSLAAASSSGRYSFTGDTTLQGTSLGLTSNGSAVANPSFDLGNHNLTVTITNGITVDGSIGGTAGRFDNVNNFVVGAGAGRTTFDGNFTTLGSQTYNGNGELLTADTVLTAGSTNPAGAIAFNAATIYGFNDNADFAHNLTLVTGTAASPGVTISQPFGTTHPFLSLTATGQTTNGSALTTSEPVTINAQTVAAGTQSYGTLTLGGSGATTLTSTLAGGSITSNGAVTGTGQGFNVFATGTGGATTFLAMGTGANPLGATDFEVAGVATFNGAINAASFALGKTTVGTEGLFTAGNVTVPTVVTSAGQLYGEPVFLGAATTLSDTNKSDITLALVRSNTATAQPLTVNTGGTTTFGGTVGAGGFPLLSLTTDAGGTTQINGGSITTSGAAGQQYNDNVTLGVAGANPATTLTASGNSVVTFAGTLESAQVAGGGGTPQALTIQTGGLTTFGKQVGGAPGAGGSAVTAAPALASLTVAGGGAVNIAPGVTTVTTNGGVQDYSQAGRVTLTGDTTLKGYQLLLNPSATGGLSGQNGPSGPYSLVLDFQQPLTITSGFTGINNFETFGPADLDGTFQTAGTQTYDGAVTLQSATTLTTTGNLTFNGTVDGASDLTLQAQGGGAQVVFGTNALVGNSTPIGNFNSTTAGGTIFGMNAGASTAGSGGFNARSVVVTGPVRFNAAGSTAADITFANNPHPTILTSGTQTYLGAVTLGAGTALISTGTGGNGAINFGQAGSGVDPTLATINSAAGTTYGLSLATAGTQTFNGLIGVAPGLGLLGGLSTGTGDTVFNLNVGTALAGVRVQGNLSTGGATSFNVAGSSLARPSVLTLGNGTQTYGGNVTLTGAVTVLNSAGAEDTNALTFTDGGSITFNGTVTGPASTEFDVRAGLGSPVFAKQVDAGGAVDIGNAAATFNQLVNVAGKFSVEPNNASGSVPTNPGPIDLNGSVFNGNALTFNGPVVLSDNTTLTAGTTVLFAGALDGSNLLTNAPYRLTINAPGGTTFQGIVGNLVPLASLTIKAGGTTTFAMNLADASAGKGGVNVLGALNIQTAVVFGTQGNGNAVPTVLTGGSYLGQAYGGSQTYGGAVTVGVDTSLQDGTTAVSASTGNIAFNGRINAATNGGASLSVSANGDEIFNQPIGYAPTAADAHPLANLRIDNLSGGTGTTRFNMDLAATGAAAGVRLTGLLSVGDAVSFAVNGATNAAPAVLSGGTQTYAKAATLASATVLTSNGGGNVTFSDAIDSDALATPRALTVNTTGNEVFSGLVGYKTPLLSLTTDATGAGVTGGQARFLMTLPTTGATPGRGGVNVTGNVLIDDGAFFRVANSQLGGTVNQPSVVSGGTQTYGAVVTLASDTVLTSNGGGLAFNSTVDSLSDAARFALTTNTPATGSLVTFAQAVGGTHALSTLTTSGGGTTQINGGSVTTIGAQSYLQAVTLGQDTLLQATAAGANVLFNSSLDGTHNLTVNADTTTFAAVGNAAPLINLTVNAPSGALFNYNPGLFSAGNASVNLAGQLVINGPAAFQVPAMTLGTVDFVRTGVTVAGLAPVPANGQDYFGAFALTGSATFTDGRSGGITFHQTADASIGAATANLIVGTGGVVSFLGRVGGLNPLTSLTTSGLGQTGAYTLFGVAGSTAATPTVLTSGAQTYNDAVRLGSNTVLASSGAGGITFNAPVDSETAAALYGLTVNTAGLTLFGPGAAVGGANPLGFLITDNAGAADLGTQLGGGSVVTAPSAGTGATGAQSYNDAVSLGADTTLLANGGAITFAATLDSVAIQPFALTTNTTGVLTLGGPVGGNQALASLTQIGGPVQINGGRVSTVASATTSGTQSYGGAVLLGADTVLASRTVGGATGGTIRFDSTVDGAFALGVNTGGLTVFNGLVGSNTALAALFTNNAGAAGEGTQFNMTLAGGSRAGVMVNGPVNIDDAVLFNVKNSSLTQPGVLTLGNASQNYGGAATLGTTTFLVGAAALPAAGGAFTGGGAVNFNSPQGVTGAAGTSLSVRAGVGTTVFGAAINVGSLDLGGASAIFAGPVNVPGLLSVRPNGDLAGGSIQLNGGGLTTAGAQTYRVAVILGADTVLTSLNTAGDGGDITFGSTVNSDGLAARALTVNTPGNEIFRGIVGGRAGLASLATDTAGTVGGQARFSMDVNGQPVGIAGVNVIGAVTINDGTRFNVTGSSALNNAVRTGLGQTYAGPTTLQNDTFLASNGAGTLTFGSTVDGAYNLTLNSAGDEVFNGQVGGTAVLASLTTDANAANAGGRTVFNYAGGTLASPSVRTSGAQTYNDDVSLGADTVLTSNGGGTLAFNGSVDGAFALALNSAGNEVFGGRVGGTTPLASLSTDTDPANAGGQVIFNLAGTAPVVQTVGAQIYNDAAVLQSDATLNSAGGALVFNSTVDGAHALFLNTAGTTSLNGAVGSATPLTSLTTNAGGNTVLNGGSVVTTAGQTYGDAVQLGKNTVLTSTNAGAMNFNGTVDGAFALTVNSQGNETFQGAVGGATALASLTTDDDPGNRGGFVIVAVPGEPSITTTGAQTYNDAVMLGAATTLSAGSSVTAAAVSGGFFDLTVNASRAAFGSIAGVDNLRFNVANAVFSGAVQGTSLLVTGTTDLNGGAVSTTGDQTYNGLLTLGAPTSLDAGGALTVVSLDGGTANALTVTAGSAAFGPVNGVGDFTLRVQGNVLFSDVVNARSLSLDSGTLSLNGGSVNTSGGQDYTATITLGKSTVLSAGNATINVNGTINAGRRSGDAGLTVNAGNAAFRQINLPGDLLFNVAGTTTFKDAVAARSLTVANLTSFDGGSVLTTGNQSYNGEVTLNAATTLASSGVDGSITVASVNGNRFDLTASSASNVFGPINGAGNLTFQGAGGSTAGSLTTFNGAVDAASLLVQTAVINLNAGQVVTSGDQTYEGATLLQSDTQLISDGGQILFASTLDSAGGRNGGVYALTLDTAGASVLQGDVGGATPLASLTVTGPASIGGAQVVTRGDQVYGGNVSLNPQGGDSTLLNANDGNVRFEQDVVGASGSLRVQGHRVLAQGDITTAGDLDLEAHEFSDANAASNNPALLILAGRNYASTSGGVFLNASNDYGTIPNPNLATIYLSNPNLVTIRGTGFTMGYLQRLFAAGSVTANVGRGTASLSDMAARNNLTVQAGTIRLLNRPAGTSTGGRPNDGLNFVANSINFGDANILYANNDNKKANFVTAAGNITIRRVEGISLFKDPNLFTQFRQTTVFSPGDFAAFEAPFQPVGGGSQTLDTAAALSGALPDQKPLDVAVDVTVTASQMEELTKLGIHPRMARKQERTSLTSKRALFAQLVDGQDQENYGRLQPIKGGVSRLVPSDYVVVVDRMSEREVQNILTAFESLYGKNKEKAPQIGEAFQTAFNDYSTEKQTADPAGFSPYIQEKPGKYPDVDKDVRGFDNLFGYIEHLGLTPKEVAKAKEHIAADLNVSGVSPDEMVKVIDSLRAKIPKDQKAPSTKLPPAAPASAPAPGATNPPAAIPAAPAPAKPAPPKTARQPAKKDTVHKTARRAAPVKEDRRHEVAGL